MKAATFSTSRNVRKLAGICRDFARVDGPFEDVGKTSGEEVRAWVEEFTSTRPNHILTRDWEKAAPELRDRVVREWEHLRGQCVEEKAAAWSERHNARVRAANPLFDAMGALDEVAKLTTPDQMLSALHEEHVRSQERMARPSVEDMARSRLDVDAQTDDRMSINQCKVWSKLLSYSKDPDPEAAMAELRAVSGDDPDRTRSNLAHMWKYVGARTGPDEGPLAGAFNRGKAALQQILAETQPKETGARHAVRTTKAAPDEANEGAVR